MLHLDQPANQQIKPGMRFTVETLDNERKRIAGLLSDNGFFRFNKDFIHFAADTIMGRKDIALTLQLRKYKPNNNSPEVDHTRYLIRDVLSKVMIVIESIFANRFFSMRQLSKRGDLMMLLPCSGHTIISPVSKL